MACHESAKTTKLYDRTSDTITLDEVERAKGSYLRRDVAHIDLRLYPPLSCPNTRLGIKVS
jgi:hypothetical protein